MSHQESESNKCAQDILRKQLSLNVNAKNAVRNIHGKIYVDFLYIGQRIREYSGLPCNCENAKLLGTPLDKTTVGTQAGLDVLQNSGKKI